MIKFIVTFTHFIQLLLHGWFMYQCIISFGYNKNISMIIWDQVRFLTNLSNWMMFSYLIPFLFYDIINYNSNKIQDRYPQWSHAIFQAMNPIIALVMISYQAMVYINPSLLVINFQPNQWQLVLLFYLHAGNFLLMQIEYFLYEHPDVPQQFIGKFFFSYTVIYLMIYGIICKQVGLYFQITGEHVYAFQAQMEYVEIAIMYTLQFFALFIIDKCYKYFLQKTIIKSIIFENLLDKQNKTNKKKRI